MSDKKPLDSDLVQAGLLALQVALREDASASQQGKNLNSRSTEEILADVGFTIADIARLTGRPYDTVKTKLRRARSRVPTSGLPTRVQEVTDGEDPQ